jgi:hypothetical protein
LPKGLHTGVLPNGGGYHHYPAPIVDIVLFKHADFKLWVLDEEGQPVAVTPTSPRGLGDGRVQVLYTTPHTALNRAHRLAQHAGEPLILPPDHPLARQAYREQIAAPPPSTEPTTLTQSTVAPAQPARVG